MLLGLVACELKDSRANKVQLGNNPGNIINGGLIASDNECIYYAGLNEEGLFSKKLDGTDTKKLSSDHVEFINVQGNYLYYRKSGSDKKPNIGGLYKIRTDGMQEQRLLTGSPFYINVVDNWVYYINQSYSTDVCRIKTDGTSQQVLYPGHYQCLTSDGTNLYFGRLAGPGTSMLYRGSLDGAKIVSLSRDTMETFFVYNNWIYYTKGYNKLCRMDKRTLKSTVLLASDNLDADFIVPNKNTLYMGGVSGIHEFNPEGRNLKTIFNVRVINFGMASGYIYFTTAEWDRNNMRHTKTFLKRIIN
jgi:hypothetical protein